MAMSATAAAKRRRAGGLLSSPMLQPPHVLQSIPTTRLISTLQNIQQDVTEQNNINMNLQRPNEQNQPVNNIDGSKILTLQQVIKILDTRLINLEKATKSEPEQQPQSMVEINTNEIISQCESQVKMTMESSIDEIISRKIEEVKTEMFQTTEAIVLQHMNDFNERYEILATEILNVKNLLLELQSYTMNVNKMLLEERINIFSEVTTGQFKTTNDVVKLGEDVVVLEESEESKLIEEPVQRLEAESQYEEPVQSLEAESQPEEPVQSSEAESKPEEPVQSLEAESQYEEPVQSLEYELQYEEPVQSLDTEHVVENTIDLPPVDQSFTGDVYDEATQAILNTTISTVESKENDEEFIVASSKGKKGKNAKNQRNKNTVNIEQEVSLSI